MLIHSCNEISMFYRIAKGVEEQKRNKQEMENYLKAPVSQFTKCIIM